MWKPGRVLESVRDHLWEYHGIDAGKLKGMSLRDLDDLHQELHGSEKGHPDDGKSGVRN